MRSGVVVTALASLALLAGCGGDGGDGTKQTGGGAESRPEPEVTLAELRACLVRKRVPIVGRGQLSGKGVDEKIPMLIVGKGDLTTATSLLVFPTAEAAKSFLADPPPAGNLVDPVGRTGNVVKARSSSATGSPAPIQDEAAIDSCIDRR